MDKSTRESKPEAQSRKVKAISVHNVEEFPSSKQQTLEPILSPARKRHRDTPRSHYSLPADLIYPLDKLDFSSELRCSVIEESNPKQPLSPVSRITAFRKELELLKGCVSKDCSTMFSPSTSPDLSFPDTFHTSSVRPPPLPVDEPFRILSSSSHVVLPMEEYFIHVPVIESEPSEGNLSVLEKIDTEFSITDLSMFSNDSLYDECDDTPSQVTTDQSNDFESLQSLAEGKKSQDSLIPLSRQGSLEYDHLEPGACKDESKTENKDNAQPDSITNDYSVSVQFHDTTSDSNEFTDHETSASTLTSMPVSLEAEQSVSNNHHKDPNIHAHINRNPIFSSSIPDKLNSIHIKHPINEQHSPSKSTTGIIEPSYDKCHCPVCCSCGSSQKQLADVAAAWPDGRAFIPHAHCDDTISNASWPTCPLEKYSAHTGSKKCKYLLPKIAVSQGISKRIDKTLSGKDKCFGSSVEISHSSSVIEDELEISSNYGNSVYCEPDNQSIFSIHSLTSYQSGLTCHSYCSSNHHTFNKGVEGSVFKERMELISQWYNEFNDQQRNSMLMRLLGISNCSQMHLLSVEMEPILHHSCPHNCQDLLSWLPPSIVFKIMGYLDPVSLCRASQVSKTWFTMANDPLLWKRLTFSRNWLMSSDGHLKQLDMFTPREEDVQWKLMFAERFRLRRNWLKGYCTVRTFEGHSQGISCVQFDDTRIVSGSWDKTIKVWNRRTNTAWAALTLAGHSGTVRCLHLHGNRLVSGSSDRTIKVWDLATNNVNWVGAACKATMIGHLHTVRCLKADDFKVVSGSYDHTLKIWDIKTGTCTKTLRGHRDAVLCLQFDNEKVISGSKDTTIKVWDFKHGQCKLTLHGHEGAVSCLQFDDNRIISGALDRLIKIWNLSTGQCVRTIDWIKSEGHTGVVRHLQADGWKLVSAADDKTLKVWSVQSGERLLTLRSHTDGVTCLQFNDQVIVSGSYDKTVKLWDFSVC